MKGDGAVRVRKADSARDDSILAPENVVFEFKQADGSWLACPFVTGLSISIVPDQIPTATLTVLLQDVGLEFADPEQIRLVQDFRERVVPS